MFKVNGFIIHVQSIVIKVISMYNSNFLNAALCDFIGLKDSFFAVFSESNYQISLNEFFRPFFAQSISSCSPETVQEF